MSTRVLTVRFASKRDDLDIIENISHLLIAATNGEIGDPSYYEDIEIKGVAALPSTQILVTLDQGDQVAVFHEEWGLNVAHREASNDAWAPPYVRSYEPHKKGTYYFGSY